MAATLLDSTTPGASSGADKEVASAGKRSQRLNRSRTQARAQETAASFVSRLFSFNASMRARESPRAFAPWNPRLIAGKTPSTAHRHEFANG
eukprot:scaffold923_cov256-Pinguiococcus_pyrenoidosus.AAC.26